MSIESLCELFVRFVTRTALDVTDFDACKRLLLERGEIFARTSIGARTKIAQLGAPFVQGGDVVLTHGYSRMVVAVLLAAAESRHFRVIVAESHPDGGGHTTAQQLADAGVPVTVIEDAAVARSMSRVQMVMCGAEAVVESGGIVSKTGTYQMAIVASACKKPFYVAAESTKFARIFPLSQLDLPEHETTREHAAFAGRGAPPPNVLAEKPSRDYTPPCYITMLVTDLGVLTPSAVSDELIKLFT
jgi:translation initiation factor eIF-2B subunit alpha